MNHRSMSHPNHATSNEKQYHGNVRSPRMVVNKGKSMGAVKAKPVHAAKPRPAGKNGKMPC